MPCESQKVSKVNGACKTVYSFGEISIIRAVAQSCPSANNNGEKQIFNNRRCVKQILVWVWYLYLYRRQVRKCTPHAHFCTRCILSTVYLLNLKQYIPVNRRNKYINLYFLWKIVISIWGLQIIEFIYSNRVLRSSNFTYVRRGFRSVVTRKIYKFIIINITIIKNLLL